MFKRIILAATLNVAWLGSAFAQIGQPWIHDPSTLVECEMVGHGTAVRYVLVVVLPQML